MKLRMTRTVNRKPSLSTVRYGCQYGRKRYGTVTVGYALASERANSDHVTSARALPHTVATLNATPPSYLSSLTATHRFTSIRRIFHFSASLSPHPKPQDDANQTTQDSTADATSARLAHPPVNHVTHVALDNSPADLPTRTLILHWT